jgi:spore coat protein U-like protein
VTVKSTLPVLALGVLASGLVVASVHAATASTSIGVSATVQASCLASTVSVDCSNSVSYNVSLSAVMTHDANLGTRPMLDSGFAPLGSALSSSPGGIANWGQAVSTDTLAWLGSGFSSLLARNGRYPAAQCAAFGADADTIIVVVTY